MAGVLCLAAICLGLAAGASADVRDLRFERIVPPRSQFWQPKTHAIAQDRTGYIWFGTLRGLLRYDGVSFVFYIHDDETPGGLASDLITSLLQDSEGNLWIGTDKGLHVWSPVDDEVRPVAQAQALGPTAIAALLEDRDGRLWIAGAKGLARLNPSDLRFELVQLGEGNVASQEVVALQEGRDGHLWVGTSTQLLRFDPATDEVQPLELGGLSAPISKLLESDDGALWVATAGDGLYRVAADREQVARYRHDPDDAASLASDTVYCLHQDDLGTLWVGTEAGLDAWSPRDQEFVKLGAANGIPAGTSIRALYQDRGGVLWVGTWQGDVYRAGTRAISFSHLGVNRDPHHSLTSSRVISMADDPVDGSLWVGTYDGGVVVLDTENTVVSVLRHDTADPNSLSGDAVTSLVFDGDETLWAATLRDGINRYDTRSGAVRRYRHDPADPDSLGADSVLPLLVGKDGTLWVGTRTHGLDAKKGEVFRHYPHDPEEPGSLSDNEVRSLLLDVDGTLWVGTRDGGLNRLVEESDTFQTFRNDASDPDSLSSDAVLALYLDANQTLWLGTRNGLNRWDRDDRLARQPRFHHYGFRQGLLGSIIFGIVEDARGDLWLSTERGISQFSPRTGGFLNYDQNHGLPSGGFNYGSYHEAADGQIYFGSNLGLTYFRPEDFPEADYTPSVVVSSLYRNNRREPLGIDRGGDLGIELTHRDQVVGFEFTLLDYLAPNLNWFEYKLDGFDQDWNELTDGRRATYTNLPAGRYTLRVRGANAEGVWSAEEATLPLEVLPAPWATWWAYAAYALAVVGVVFLYVHAQSRKLQKEAEYAKRLELEVQARTRKLEEQNERLQYANKLLEIASVTDSLTGVRNRRFLLTNVARDIAHLDRIYAEAAARGDTEEAAYVFLLFDLDGFKEVNDHYGHSAGDLVLFQIRDLLTQACRSSDTLIRWGGDEFMIVGRATTRDHVEVLAERIQSSVAAHLFDIGSANPIRLTCSLGFACYPFVATHPALHSWEDVVEIADRALYVAKQRGPNRWVGIFGSEKTAETPTEDLLTLLAERPELLEAEGSIRLLTSERTASPKMGAGKTA